MKQLILTTLLLLTIEGVAQPNPPHPCGNGKHHGDKHCPNAPLSALPLQIIGIIVIIYMTNERKKM